MNTIMLRIKQDFAGLVNEILDQFPVSVWTSETSTFLDPEIGGGQIVREIVHRLRAAGHTDENINNRVFGLTTKLGVELVKKHHKLPGTYIAQDFLTWETNMEFDVVVGNPPYTDGTQGQADLYSLFIKKVMELSPAYIAFIVPSTFISGNGAKKDLRDQILKSYDFKFLRFLDIKKDWNSSIEIDTVAWVCGPKSSENSEMTVVSSNGKSYKTPQPSSPRFDFDNKKIFEFIEQIQTTNKIKLVSSKVIKGLTVPSKEVLLSVADEDGGKVINTDMVYESNNDKWRVAFGYMRSKTCALVAPGVGVPGKYRYIAFESKEAAIGFRRFMMSMLIRFIISFSFRSRTLDNPQLKLVPMLDDFTPFAKGDVDEKIRSMFGIPEEVEEEMKKTIGNHVPF